MPAASSPRFPITVFCTRLQGWEPERVARLVTGCGFDGWECPVRAKGQVEPARVEDDLPPYVEALRRVGSDLYIAATDILRVDQPNAERTLRTLAKLGIGRLRLNFREYDLSRPLLPQVREAGAVLKDIAAACQELGLLAGVQNHSGAARIGAHVWDVSEMLRGLDPRHMGFCFDLADATVEGGLSWPIQARLAEPFFSWLMMKDFYWQKTAKGWEPNWCPFGEGMVDPAFFSFLKCTAYRGPVSLEFFYEMGDLDQMTACMKRDLAVLKARLV